MIDFYKIGLSEQQPGAWLQNPLLRDSVITSLTNEGEVREERVFYRGQTVCVKPGGYVEISGSLHKFYTGATNGTDFSEAAIALSVKDLGEALRFEPSAARLKNVEFGVNIGLPIQAKILLKRALLFGNADFTSRRTFGGDGHQIDAEQQRYTFKAYDKAAQLQSTGTACSGHLLRVEVRATKMLHLAPAKLVTLADLARPGSLAPLGELLVKTWGKVLFRGPAAKLDELPKPRRELLTQGRNAAYWEELSPASFRKQRGQFRLWTDQHSADPLPAFVGAQLAATWARLLTGEA